jgi:hypothetical protein
MLSMGEQRGVAVADLLPRFGKVVIAAVARAGTGSGVI